MAQIAFNPNIIPAIISMNQSHIWFDFDKSADVLYISYQKPQNANDSIMEDDNLIYNYCDDKIVGITVLNVSKYYYIGAN